MGVAENDGENGGIRFDSGYSYDVVTTSVLVVVKATSKLLILTNFQYYSEL